MCSISPLEGLNKRSDVAPTSSVSFPTLPCCCGSRAALAEAPTNGRSANGATFPYAPWPSSTQAPPARRR
jgi:hypothetical protein